MLLRFRVPFLTTAAALGFALAAHAQTATEAGGAKFDNEIQLHGTKLQLNGAGVRYKAIFKVYAAGLYLAAKASTTQAVLSAAGPRRINIVMLREIDGNELGKLFIRGMEQNSSREEFGKAIPGTIKMGEIFATRKKLNAGESFQIDWVPGQGTLVFVNGKQAAEPIKEPEFYAAMMKIWLGNNPADSQLKDALLGQAPRRSNEPGV